MRAAAIAGQISDPDGLQNLGVDVAVAGGFPRWSGDDLDGGVAHDLGAARRLGQAVTVDGRPALAGSIHYPGMAMFERVAAAVTSLSFDGAATMVAAGSAGRMDIVRALLARRWPVDTRDRAGMTAGIVVRAPQRQIREASHE